MNLLELQVLAVVSRIPDGSDAPSPDFAFELAPQHPHQPRQAEASETDHQSAGDSLKPRT